MKRMPLANNGVAHAHERVCACAYVPAQRARDADLKILIWRNRYDRRAITISPAALLIVCHAR